MALTTNSSASSSSVVGSLPTGESNTITVRLDRNNFLLWKTQVIPNLIGSGRFGYIDGSLPAPPKTITTGTGADAKIDANPEYIAWQRIDQRILSVMLGSMTEDILT